MHFLFYYGDDEQPWDEREGGTAHIWRSCLRDVAYVIAAHLVLVALIFLWDVAPALR